MNLRLSCAALAALTAITPSLMAQGQPAPQTMAPWAYPVPPPPAAGAPAAPPVAAAKDDGSPKRVSGSDVALTLTQIRDLFNPPDWHPDNHPAMPEIVGHGRRPDVRACGYCHYPNGQGRPENASLAGLPAGYIIQQMEDYRNGLRKSAEPRMGPPAAMVTLGKVTTDAESRSAAAYFSSFKFKPWIRVVESATAPVSRAVGNMWVPATPAATEPLGARIIETPESMERSDLRDSASGFVAYVPVGSIKKGEALVKTGGAGKTIQCAICHGADLKGLGNVPPLAGRSPSYVARQLYDIQIGVRNGAWAPLMKEAVAKLTPDDLLSIAAYTASLAP